MGAIEQHLTHLNTLEDGWDGHRGRKPTADALHSVLGYFTEAQIVPLSDGGLQIEWHRDGFDVEIEISPGGNLRHISIGQAEGSGGYSYRRHTT